MKKSNSFRNLNECNINLDSSNPILSIDYELYQQYLDNSEYSDDEKNKFLNVIWSIIVNFVDLGFETHPVQQVLGETRSLDGFLKSSANHMLQKQIQTFVSTKNENNIDHKGVYNDRSNI